MRTFGPTSLSDIIFENNSAVRERTGKLVELQNKSNKYIKAPEKKNYKKNITNKQVSQIKLGTFAFGTDQTVLVEALV